MKEKSIKRQAVKSFMRIALLIIFVFGMLCGTLIIQNSGSFEPYVPAENADTGFLQILISCFFKELVFLLIPYMCGYGAVFQFIPFILTAYKGLGLGYYLSSVYLMYGVKGVAYSALAVVPPALILIFVIITACRESVRLSNLFFQSFSSRNHVKVELQTIKLYNIKFLLLILFLLAYAVLSAVCNLFFSGILKA